MEDILVGCIQAIAEFISMDRDGGESDRIWPFLKQANLVRLQGGSHSSAAGHLSRLRQIHEAPSGQYRITSAFIRLLLMLVRRMRFQADIDSPLSGDALLLTSGYLVHFTTDICGVSGGGSAGGSHSSSSFIGWPVRSLQTRQRLCKDVQAIWREILGDNPMAPLLASVGQQQLSSLAKWGHCIYQSALAPLLWLSTSQSNSNSICSNQPATSAFLLAMLSPVSPTQLPVSGIPRSFTEEVLQLLKSLLLIRQSLGPEHLPRSAVDRLLLQPVQSADGKPLIAVLGSYISLPWGTLGNFC
jgi:hypothetical protein